MILPPSTRAFYQGAADNLSGLRAQATRLQGQIATGERLTRSSDDPLAASRLRDLARTERLSTVHQDHAAHAMARLARTDDTLSAMAGQMVRVKELALLAASGTASDSDRAMIATEITSIRDHLLALANGTDNAGHALFGGTGTGPAYTLDGNGDALYTGGPALPALALGADQLVEPGLTGPQFLSFEANGAQSDLFATLAQLAATQTAGGAGAASAAHAMLDTVDAGLQSITTAQTIIGVRMGWLDVVAERHIAEGEATAEGKARLGGADIANTMVELQHALTALEASQASFVRLANLSLFSLLR